MLARPSVAGVGHGNLAQRGRVTQRTRTGEAGHGISRHFDGASAAILAPRSGSRMAGVGKLAVLAHVLRRAAVKINKKEKELVICFTTFQVIGATRSRVSTSSV